MRIWRTAPSTAIVAVVALAMGIGFTTTMFSIVHGATRPLPFVDAQRVVAIEKFVSRTAAADVAPDRSTSATGSGRRPSAPWVHMNRRR